MADFMRLGGVTMWPILMLGLATIAAAARYAARPEAAHARLPRGLGRLTLLLGVMGTTLGCVVTLVSMGSVPPEDRFVAMIGVGESLTNLTLALGLVVVASAIGVIGSTRRA
jgi:hypothetical protein